MGYFVMFIFILLHMTQPVKAEGAYPGFDSCLIKWRIYREYKAIPSAFLTDQTLVEEICSNTTDLNVWDMDRCVRQRVDQSQDTVLAFWAGIRDKYVHICEKLSDFLRYEHCRTNRDVVDAYDSCPKRYPDATCRDFRERIVCIKKALHRYCQEQAISFFTLLLRTEFAPLMDYIHCSFDISLFADPTPSSTLPPKSTTEVTHNHKDRNVEAMETIQEQVIVETEVFEENITLYSVSSRPVSNIYVIVATMCLKFWCLAMAEYFS